MFIADLHIHSKYSRATSKECVPEFLDKWARRKGIDLIGTGDFTHPAWRDELKEKLVPAEEGLYVLKNDLVLEDDLVAAGSLRRPRFMVTGEISSIYKKDGKTRKVHNLILLPSIEDAEAISHKLEAIGNIHSDGRPILGLDSRDLLEIVMEECDDAIFIPAHIWTPHFSMFGAFSGFSTVEECFEDMTPYIHALETGLSSDPPMNWRLSQLDSYTLVSNSDAHSPSKLGREANLFDVDLSYPAVARALGGDKSAGFAGTIEFFPEEGKYHYDGHRACGMCMTPSEADLACGRCPVCGRKLTIGVLHRVEELADRDEGFVPEGAMHYESLVPLPEVIAASTGLSPSSSKVDVRYAQALRELGDEFFILRQAPIDDVERVAGACVAEGVRRVRNGQITMVPGYDGEYGKLQIFEENELDSLSGQMCFFEAELKKDDGATKQRAETGRRKKSAVKSEEAEIDSGDAPKSVLAGLNEEQREAVLAEEPAVAVIAGPGTGKTKTLVSKVIYLIEECKVKPSCITAVTFTNKAAGEMRERLEAHFKNKRFTKGLNIGTFHSICLDRLSAEDGTGKVTVIDEHEALNVAKKVTEELGVKVSARKLLQKVSRLKNGAGDEEDSTSIPHQACELYCKRLREYGVLDYDDILIEALSLFEQDLSKKSKKASQFTYLLVDEFQDINDVQYDLVKTWSRAGKGVFVIGDPDQSIYGFRGSNSHCFRRFEEEFEGARFVRLVKNYRSTPEVIECALPVISAQNEPAGGERLLEAQREHGEKVSLLEAGDDFSEAIFVAKEINRMVGGIDMLDVQMSGHSHRDRGPISFSDIAVLYRTHRQSEVLEKCLRKEGIPYIVTGKDKTLDDDMVRGTLCFFKSLLNPSDVVSLHTCLVTAMGCTEDVAERFVGSYMGDDCENVEGLEQSKGLLKWMQMAEKYRECVRDGEPQQLVQSWMEDNDMSDNENLERLANMAVFHGDMESFLNALTFGRERDVARSGNRTYTPEAVSLMTFHGAKGLEFPIVFLCGVNEGTIPLESLGRTTDEDEERRLFYVGMTRAKDELIMLTSPKQSKFLNDIPGSLLQMDKTYETKKPEGKQLSFFEL